MITCLKTTYLLNIIKDENYEQNLDIVYIYHKISQINISRLSNTGNAINVQFSLILIGRRVWYYIINVLHSNHSILHTNTN